MTADEAGEVLGLGRTTVYALMATDALRSVKIGGARRVPVTVLREYVDRPLEMGAA